MSQKSSVLFHPTVLIVVLRLWGNNKLIFGAMPKKIPGVWGQSPQGAQYRIRKLSDFRIGYLAFPSDGRSPRPGARGAKQLDLARSYPVKIAQIARWAGRPPRARCSPSPAGGRGGRGVRVVTAQTQAHKQLTHPNAPIKTIKNHTAPPPRKSSRCAVFPLTPSPSPRPGARGARQLNLARGYQVK